jgi:hypothetical protein
MSCSFSIVLSGAVDPNNAYDAGANAFVRKPADLQKFLAKIRGVCGLLD